MHHYIAQDFYESIVQTLVSVFNSFSLMKITENKVFYPFSALTNGALFKYHNFLLLFSSETRQSVRCFMKKLHFLLTNRELNLNI